MGKGAFTEMYNEHIKRPGAQGLLEWLNTTDFFTAPASTRYHSSYDGGLCEHSYNVFVRLQMLCKEEHFSMETLAVCGLLHDICKANFYKKTMRNVKNEETGVWEKEPFYKVEEQFHFGHGEKSVFLIERFLRLTDEEAVAIRYHMGDFVNDRDTSAVYASSRLALYLHMADLEATYIDEVDK